MQEIAFEEKAELIVSDMAENIIGSEIIKLANEVNEKIRNGERIHNLTIGDFNPGIFPIPRKLNEEIVNAYNAGHTNYPNANGIPELREAVSRFLLTKAGLEYDKEMILIAAGGRPLIYGMYQAVLDPGDAVIFPVPSWNNNHYCHLTSARQIPIETQVENKFMPTADEIKPFIKDANLIALCSPLNPTGTTFTKQALEDICNLVIEENNRRGRGQKPVYLLYDQIYWLLTYGDTVHYDPVTICPEMRNYTLLIDGISKAFSATGVRVGWACGPQKIINKMKAILSHVGAWAPKAEQVATTNFLNGEDEVNMFLSEIKSKIQARLVAFYEGFRSLKEMGYKVDAIAPQAAMYLTVKLDLCGLTTPEGFTLETTKDVTKYILDEAKIALVPFYAFGADKNSCWYRLSIGTASIEDITSFFENLKNALARLS